MESRSLLRRQVRLVLVRYLRRTRQPVERQRRLGFNQRDRHEARFFVSGILRPFHGCDGPPVRGGLYLSIVTIVVK